MFVHLFLSSAVSLATTISIPLDFEVTNSPNGGFLKTDFDFAVVFSQIESIELSFTMDQGFEGYAVATSNSFFSNTLSFGISDSETNPDLGDVQGLIKGSLWSVPVNELISVEFVSPYIFVGEELISDEELLGRDRIRVNALSSPTWPDYLLQGTGQITAVEVGLTSSGSPLNGPVTSSVVWSPPQGLSNATLTITGTVVPEPGGAVLVVLLIGCSICSRYPLWRSNRPPFEAT